MRTAICHYSFHRTCKEKNWTVDDVAAAVKRAGAEAVDFHVRLLGDAADVDQQIRDAVAKHGLVLSGLSCSNHFGQKDAAASAEHVELVKGWLELAAKVEAPVSRIFGGADLPFDKRDDPAEQAAARQRLLRDLEQVVPVAEKLGVVLALENHGSFPGLGSEQADIVRTVDSPYLRATIDVGNYMQVGGVPHEEVATAAPYAAYVHYKDFKKIPDDSRPVGYRCQGVTLGDGEVDLKACYQALKTAGYDGFIALEYEGQEDEAAGVARSIQAMRASMA
jgi:sugar phosphate isomerase/epimerase